MNSLREKLGFESMVMTDALEMNQFFGEPDTGDAILPSSTVEGYVNVAEKCIVADCGVLYLDENGTWVYTDEVLFARGTSAS